jgi:signal transduction histidine kinase
MEDRESVLARVLEAVAGIGCQLEPAAALEAIVAAAVDLTGARYGALGLIGEAGQLTGFIPVGMSKAEIARIDHWPRGRGLLGELIRHPGPLRLADLGAHPGSAGFPPGHPPMRSFLAAPVLIRDEFFGNLYLTDKQDGADFTAQDEGLLVALAGAAGLAVENARLRAEARRHEQWQRATAEVTQQLLAAEEPRDVLALVAQHAMELSGADGVIIALPDESGEHVVVTEAVGAGAQALLGIVTPIEKSLSGIVMTTGERQVLENFSGDPRVAAASRERTRIGPAVAVPLGVPGDTRGVMIAGRQPGSQPMAPSAMDMVTTFAVQAGIGLKLAEHRRAAERIALLADRDRIGRDLHDLVVQRLFATGMSLQGVMPLVSDPEAAARIGRAIDELDGTIRDIRSTIYALQARDYPNAPGIQERLLAAAQEMTAALGFAPWLRIDERLASRVPRGITEDIVAVVREGLSNVAQHAQASQVRVVVTVADGEELTIIVHDNGSGIRSAGQRSGLSNLAQRAAELGGSLQAAQPDAGGTRLEWRVPLAGPRR